MSRLEELIQEYCPNGVEYKELQSVLKIKNGKDYKSLGAGDIPVYGSGGIMTYVDSYVYDKPSVLIPRKGSIDKLYYVDTPFWNVDTVFYTEINVTIVLPRYVFHCLLREHLEKLNTAGGVPSLTQKVLNVVKIPVPPLPVQEEIVRILDSFTQLTAELQAELQARKKQYEYYSSHLLCFREDDNWQLLGEIAEITDYVANGSFASLRENVSYKNEPNYAALIRTADYSTGFKLEKMVFVDEHAYNFLAKSKLYGGEIIINNVGAGVGTTFRCPNLGIPMSLAPNSVMVKTKNDGFYYYWFKSRYGQDAIQRIVGKSAMPKFNKTGLRSIRVPVPSIKEQERIVAILDRFDTLCNDLSSNLPAEIQARQKQYEYYRDKLLTFPPLS
jgi:type I restriction enzyme S subunit